MPEDKLTRLLAMQRQLLCGNAIDKAAAAAEYGVSAKSIQRGPGNAARLVRHAGQRPYLRPRSRRLPPAAAGGSPPDQKRGAGGVQNSAGEPRLYRGRARPHPQQAGGLLHPGAKPQGRAGAHRQRAVPLCSAAPRAKVCNGGTSCGRWARPSATTACWRWITPAPAARPSTAACSRWASCSASIISIWRRSLRASTKKEHFANPEDRSPTIYRVDRIARFHGHKRPLRHPLPRPLPGRRDAQAHPVHVRRQIAAYQVQVYRPEHRGRARPPADRQGWWNSCPKAGRSSRRRCLTATG